jgi:hypothetical protein
VHYYVNVKGPNLDILFEKYDDKARPNNRALINGLLARPAAANNDDVSPGVGGGLSFANQPAMPRGAASCVANVCQPGQVCGCSCVCVCCVVVDVL